MTTGRIESHRAVVKLTILHGRMSVGEGCFSVDREGGINREK